MRYNNKVFGLVLVLIGLSFNICYSQLNFENNASSLGIDISGEASFTLGGVSFFDFNKDGWDDITIGSSGSEPVRFFENNNGLFEEVTFNISIIGHSKQVIWVDFDNDLDYDLFVTKVDGANKLYENNGDFEFADVTVDAGFPVSQVLYSYGATFGDYDNDGFLDLFLCNKDIAELLPNQLYHNNGDGTFSDVSETAGISDVGHSSFCAVFMDYDNDGFQDIYISNDRIQNPNIMYHNNGDGTFTDESVSTNTNISANAMSTTIADYNYDGWLDIYVTNTAEGNYLLENNSDGTFTNVAFGSGTLFNSIGWGANFLDGDNDTDLDLYVSSMVNTDASGLLTTAFYECDANFEYEIPIDIGFEDDEFISFANAIGDLDNNGFSDFVVMNQLPDNLSIWQNSGNTNNWIKIELKGVESNAMGIGSWIEISIDGVSQFRYVACGEAFLGQNSQYEIFGIENAAQIDFVKVNWLSGTEDVLNNVAPNQLVLIEEGETLGIQDHQLNQVKLFPNPTNSGVFELECSEIVNSIVVMDMSGRIIETIDLNQYTAQVNLSHFSNGNYLLKMEFNNGWHHTEKLIIK
ncbi:MAG: hypothetical protein BM564_07420 [Bacteroidetes bacterium MedPE-SWsnd-G2]|nr:MAG: hypothetical protein BM564_07420 [Bacteroidetes bacterium MedPE-SWsnd-G2]